jgi:broad specificity phosphatase PhoE
MVIQQQKEAISNIIFDTLHEIEGVISSTIVGSFNDRNDLLVISDIDTIVIVDELSESLFNHCVNKIKAIPGSELGFPDREVYVNSTFGPLKFDTPQNIVIHLMIYDLSQHRQHVIKSPFTCFDWERSKLNSGPSLKEVYPVLSLRPQDFSAARRGLLDYLKDLERGAVSYRQYAFSDDQVQELTLDHQLDERHKGEYAFHIVKNCVSNYLKLVTGKNQLYLGDKLYQLWRKHLPKCAHFIDFFESISKIKLNRDHDFPEETIDRVKEFLLDFQKQLEHDEEKAIHACLIRHDKTAENDGRFLGQKSNPSILEQPQPFEHSSPQVFHQYFSSPLKRCLETTTALFPNAHIKKDSRLLEIDYGNMDGFDIHKLKGLHPNMIEAWSKGEDPPFPQGESQADVYERLMSFLKEMVLASSKDSFICTHNVVMRCLLGHVLNIPMRLWFKIPVEHIEPHHFCILDGQLIPRICKEQLTKIGDAVSDYRL